MHPCRYDAVLDYNVVLNHELVRSAPFCAVLCYAGLCSAVLPCALQYVMHRPV